MHSVSTFLIAGVFGFAAAKEILFPLFFTLYHKEGEKNEIKIFPLQSFSTVLKPNYCRWEPLTPLSVDAFGSKHQCCDDIIVMSRSHRKIRVTSSKKRNDLASLLKV